MSITKDIPVPTSYRRLHESKTLFGIHDRLSLVWGVFIAVCGFTLIFMNNTGLRNIIWYVVVICIFGVIVIVLARDVKTLDQNKLHLLLLFRIVRKKHITKKYVEPLDDLKEIVSIESVEDSGMITYPDGTTGVMILYVPPRPAEHEQDNHSTRIKNLINSLYGDFSFQFISNSIVEPHNPLLDATTEAMKQADVPKAVTSHLYSLYEEAKDKKDDVNVEFALIVSIPVTKNIAESEQLRAAFIPSVLKSFQRAGVFAREIGNRNEVVYNLRKELC